MRRSNFATHVVERILHPPQTNNVRVIFLVEATRQKIQGFSKPRCDRVAGVAAVRRDSMLVDGHFSVRWMLSFARQAQSCVFARRWNAMYTLRSLGVAVFGVLSAGCLRANSLLASCANGLLDFNCRRNQVTPQSRRHIALQNVLWMRTAEE